MTQPRCSFCNLTRDQVTILITAPNANICEGCVGSCLNTIIETVAAGNAGCAGCTRDSITKMLEKLPAHHQKHVH